MTTTITRQGCVYQVRTRSGNRIVACKYFSTLAAAQRYAEVQQ